MPVDRSKVCLQLLLLWQCWVRRPTRCPSCGMLSGWKSDIPSAKTSSFPPNPPRERCLPRKAQVLPVSPAVPGVFEWQLCLAGTLASHYCSSSSKSIVSFLQCQPDSESSICLQLCQIWDSSCFRNKLCSLFGWYNGFENQIVVLLLFFLPLLEQRLSPWGVSEYIL